ncbi:hypothetical protein MADA3029_940191 [Vibrio nigripulchritudo MADA3029]|nr:hypothetical protein VIBNIMADA3020_910188 [Vibrio nigripulchritudo MADA3020]CCN62299.1 hypothetical protein MADA3029_940191 [Vibrio nigripulchritudo MADA3029]
MSKNPTPRYLDVPEGQGVSRLEIEEGHKAKEP